MPAAGKQLKRRNHTVNKSYLRRFADNHGLLMQIALAGQARKLVSINHATVVKNFYVVPLADGTETDEAEEIFCGLEGKAVAAIRSLVDDRVWPIPDTARYDIGRWTALQYLRVPSVRRLGREVVEAFSGVGVPARTGSGEQITVKMPAELIKDMTGSRHHLELINDLLPQVTQMLCKRNWILTYYQRKSLATSDTPVVLRPAASHPAGTGIGIGTASEIHVPLDRRVALSMGDGSTGDAQCAGVTKTAIYLNDAMAKNARRYLFHHPEDDPFRGLELPGPRTRELASPEAAIGLADVPHPVPQHWLLEAERGQQGISSGSNGELSLTLPESFGPVVFPPGIGVVHRRQSPQDGRCLGPAVSHRGGLATILLRERAFLLTSVFRITGREAPVVVPL
jgi:hypothetical protein